MTTIIELQRQMKVLSSYLSSTIIFVRFYEEAWHYEVVVHGLEDLLGISKEDLQRGLADWSIIERFKEEDRVKLHELTVNAIQKSKSFTYSFFLPSRFGGVLSLRMNADVVDESTYHDKMFIVTLSER